MIRIIITLLILLLIAFVGLFLYAWSYAKSQGYTLKQLWRIYNQIEDENKKGIGNFGAHKSHGVRRSSNS